MFYEELIHLFNKKRNLMIQWPSYVQTIIPNDHRPLCLRLQYQYLLNFFT